MAVDSKHPWSAAHEMEQLLVMARVETRSHLRSLIHLLSEVPTVFAPLIELKMPESAGTPDTSSTNIKVSSDGHGENAERQAAKV